MIDSEAVKRSLYKFNNKNNTFHPVIPTEQVIYFPLFWGITYNNIYKLIKYPIKHLNNNRSY